jgi:hypothetical protein
MLTLINLYTLDKIFNEEAKIRLEGSPRALYVNCLTHHFRDRKPTVANAIQFEIFKKDIKGYKGLEKNFQLLQAAELVVIGQESIVFNNVWGQHIDREKLERVAPVEFVAGFQFHPAEKFRDELLNSQTLIDLQAMKYKATKVQVIKMIELFLKEQETFEKKYSDHADCKKHFTYWLGHNVDKMPKEAVKSQKQILGG